jgi:hypothetical protein
MTNMPTVPSLKIRRFTQLVIIELILLLAP